MDHEASTVPPQRLHEAETLGARPQVESENADFPDSIGNYRLLSRIGGGGMGAVYEAWDASANRKVALKLMRPDVATSKESIDRFRQEGELASKLAHPRCVFVLAADQDAGRPYIVMELMCGATLDGLVKENGPLSIDEALRKILDVIEGLQEAHELGLVHRDVKPSNCFLEENGRVKIGDFGLSRSLVSNSHLTRTGNFVGTPLFASPEQIKMEEVDAQSDVYSVAATLYFLLTGQAPFATGDQMATMARIVADDAPSMLLRRSELPKRLDKIVRKGLERDRRRRWRNLEEFRTALVSFIPVPPTVAGLGFRLISFLIDSAAISLLELFAFWIVTLFSTVNADEHPLSFNIAAHALCIAYYSILEGRLGWSPGKWILRLRVSDLQSTQPPGIAKAMLRVAILYLLPNVLTLFVLIFAPNQLQFESTKLIAFAWSVLSYIVIACTMREKNGYRGLHEILSKTKTFRLHWVKLQRPRALRLADFRIEPHPLESSVPQFAAYKILGTLPAAAPHQIFVGEDSSLGRKVMIWMRPSGTADLDEARRAADRETRLRWLAHGRVADRQWDALLMPVGCPLPKIIAEGRSLTWPEFRLILDQLANELYVSCKEHSLPKQISPNQVWIGADGSCQLVDAPMLLHPTEELPTLTTLGSEEDWAVTTLLDVSTLALTGRSRDRQNDTGIITAPIPVHASAILRRMVGDATIPDSPSPAADSTTKPEESESASASRTDNGTPKKRHRIRQLIDDLVATREEPTELTRWDRAMHMLGQVAHLTLWLGFLVTTVGLTFLIWVRLNFPSPNRFRQVGWTSITIALLVLAIGFFLPAYIYHGGMSFSRAGIAIVVADGRRASRLRCLARTLISFLFVALLVGIVAIGQNFSTPFGWVHISCIATSALLFLLYIAECIYRPQRAPHDFLTGTYLVPK